MAVPTLDALLGAGLNVVGVVTRPPARRGRRKKHEPTPIANLAAASGVPLLETSHPDSSESLAQIEEWEPDLGVVVAYGALFREGSLNAPKLGWINLHFSALPRWRGAAPVQWTIREGDAEAATSVFQLRSGMDTGPVYSEISVVLDGTETAGTLLDDLAGRGADQVLNVIDQLDRGTALPIEQSREGITHARPLEKKDGFVDFSGSALQVDRIIRSVTPNPGAWTTLPDGTVLKLGPVRIVDSFVDRPGEVKLTKNGVFVQCGNAAVELGDVAPAGRGWMPAAAWGRGARLEESARLGESQ